MQNTLQIITIFKNISLVRIYKGKLSIKSFQAFQACLLLNLSFFLSLKHCDHSMRIKHLSQSTCSLSFQFPNIFLLLRKLAAIRSSHSGSLGQPVSFNSAHSDERKVCCINSCLDCTLEASKDEV